MKATAPQCQFWHWCKSVEFSKKLGEGVEAKNQCVWEPRAEQPCQCRECQWLITATQSTVKQWRQLHRAPWTASNKLAKLYWPSRKRSPKRLIVLLGQKRGGARPKKFSGASSRTGGPAFKFVPTPQTRCESCVKGETILSLERPTAAFLSWRLWSRSCAPQCDTANWSFAGISGEGHSAGAWWRWTCCSFRVQIGSANEAELSVVCNATDRLILHLHWFCRQLLMLVKFVINTRSFGAPVACRMRCVCVIDYHWRTVFLHFCPN